MFLCCGSNKGDIRDWILKTETELVCGFSGIYLYDLKWKDYNGLQLGQFKDAQAKNMYCSCSIHGINFYSKCWAVQFICRPLQDGFICLAWQVTFQKTLFRFFFQYTWRLGDKTFKRTLHSWNLSFSCWLEKISTNIFKVSIGEKNAGYK